MVRSLKNPKKAKRKNKSSKNGDGSSSSNSVPSIPAKLWQPGVDALEEGEELQCDPLAYNSLHAFHIAWPCLSFDAVRDSLGLVRTPYRISAHYLLCHWNSDISEKRRDLIPAKTSNADTDADSDSDDEDGVEDDGQKAPIFQGHQLTRDNIPGDVADFGAYKY